MCVARRTRRTLYEERSMTATEPPAAEAGSSTPRRGFGVDVGGSGIKGGIVDLTPAPSSAIV